MCECAACGGRVCGVREFSCARSTESPSRDGILTEMEDKQSHLRYYSYTCMLSFLQILQVTCPQNAVPGSTLFLNLEVMRWSLWCLAFLFIEFFFRNILHKIPSMMRTTNNNANEQERSVTRHRCSKKNNARRARRGSRARIHDQKQGPPTTPSLPPSNTLP
jgi:hypothetical protein